MSVTTTEKRLTPRRRWALLLLLVLVLCLAAAVVAGPRLIQAHPDLVTNTVDRVREIVGPAPVAAVETAYYQLVDQYNRLHYRITGRSDTWQLAAPMTTPAGASSAGKTATQTLSPMRAAVVQRELTALAKATPRPVAGQKTAMPQKPASQAQVITRPGTPASTSAPTATPVPTVDFQPPAPLDPIIKTPALPGEGVWQPLATLGQPAGEPPILWQTIFRPDPDRPFAQVALVAMDLSRTRLNIVVGTKEPASDVPADGLRTGVIPADVQSGGELLAAWNGGFKAVHGHYGMMTDGVVWLPAKEGLATAAVNKDGQLTLGAWGRGVKPDANWSAWRQNNPPLIENGVVNPDVVKLANTIHWGASLSGAVFIWRSGMGVTPDDRWLIYAAGNPLSVQTLTAALQAAGASDAMQLDVNMTFEQYYTFLDQPQTAQVAGQDVSLPITGVKLIKQMQGKPDHFLVPHDRDFFYLTYRSGP
jgi:hypothetical protein